MPSIQIVDYQYFERNNHQFIHDISGKHEQSIRQIASISISALKISILRPNKKSHAFNSMAGNGFEGQPGCG